MPNEITTEGYQSLRDHIEAEWIYIELRETEGGDVWKRISTTDDRVKWNHEAEAQELEMQVIIGGGDEDITLPQTFAESVLYNVAVEGSELAKNTFPSATLTNSSDQLIIRHKIQVPQVSI